VPKYYPLEKSGESKLTSLRNQARRSSRKALALFGIGTAIIVIFSDHPFNPMHLIGWADSLGTLFGSVALVIFGRGTMGLFDALDQNRTLEKGKYELYGKNRVYRPSFWYAVAHNLSGAPVIFGILGIMIGGAHLIRSLLELIRH
jgi:hypothetical protein